MTFYWPDVLVLVEPHHGNTDMLWLSCLWRHVLLFLNLKEVSSGPHGYRGIPFKPYPSPYRVGRLPFTLSFMPRDETDTCVKALHTIREALRFSEWTWSTHVLTTNGLSGEEHCRLFMAYFVWEAGGVMGSAFLSHSLSLTHDDTHTHETKVLCKVLVLGSVYNISTAVMLFHCTLW